MTVEVALNLIGEPAHVGFHEDVFVRARYEAEIHPARNEFVPAKVFLE